MPQKLPRAVIFDLDGTLALPWQPPSENTLLKLSALSQRTNVAILSGAEFQRIYDSVLLRLPLETRQGNFWVLSVNGAHAHLYEDGLWKKTRDESLSSKNKDDIRAAITEYENAEGTPQSAHGEKMVDRQGFIAYTPLGVEVPADIKTSWDPEQSKRKSIITNLRARLSDEYDLYIAGQSTVDIVRKNANKAGGIRWLAQKLGTEPRTMLFIGDALYPGGNDYVVIETGIATKQVQNPQETADIIDELLKI